MELKPGYKQTEVGVIPEDWEMTNLYAVSKVPMQNGVFFKPSHKGSGIKLINVGDLYNQIPINSNSLELFDASANEKERFKVENGDLFFTRSSVVPVGIAHCNIYQSTRSEQVVFDSHVIRVRPNTKKVLSLYLYRFVVSSIARKYLISHSKTGTMTTIDQAVLGRCPVLIPPTKAEQTAIAIALSDTDALIQSLTRLITKKRQIKQGAMQTLLNPYENGRLKAGWVLKKLGDSCEMFSGGTPNTAIASYYGGDIQWITSGDLNKGKITEVEGRITKVGLINSSAKTISQDTLLLALYGATSGVVAISKINAAINQAVLAIIPDGSLKNVFLFYILTYLKDWIIATYTQGGQPNLSGNIIKSLELYCPDVDEQTRIATILSGMDAEIAALETKLAKYRHIKQGMMQNLLTGRIRLI